MKNLLLSIFLCLAMSFSFAQSDVKTQMKEKNIAQEKYCNGCQFFN